MAENFLKICYKQDQVLNILHIFVARERNTKASYQYYSYVMFSSRDGLALIMTPQLHKDYIC